MSHYILRLVHLTLHPSSQTNLHFFFLEPLLLPSLALFFFNALQMNLPRLTVGILTPPHIRGPFSATSVRSHEASPT